ncbi:hypothetical protein ZWY2020_015348 [Hordeum vulgare]|nr:hypothetical protein ZWY2020_015348 [Hordeum vulgare]
MDCSGLTTPVAACVCPGCVCSSVMELTKQALKSLPGKPSVHKELPPKAHPQMLESVRSKSRDALAAALGGMDSGQQSPGNVGSDAENGGSSRMQGITGAYARKDNDDDDASQIGLQSNRRISIRVDVPSGLFGPVLARSVLAR